MRLSYLLSLLLILVMVIPAEGRRRAIGNESSNVSSGPPYEQEVLRDFEKILDLWRDGRYEELFYRTAVGKQGKEAFANKMSAAPRRPACCWEKMQDARVTIKSERAAVVNARLGFEGAVPGTRFVTKGIRMKKEGGVWVIAQGDLFSLAEISKKRARYKYLPIQRKP